MTVVQEDLSLPFGRYFVCTCITNWLQVAPCKTIILQNLPFNLHLCNYFWHTAFLPIVKSCWDLPCHFPEIIGTGRRHHQQKVSHVQRAWGVGNFTQTVISKGKLLSCGDLFCWHRSFSLFLRLDPYEATTRLWIFGENLDFSKTKSKHQSLWAVLQQLSYIHRPRHQCSENTKPRKVDCEKS